MANVKFKKEGGDWYVTLNNSKLKKAKVKISMEWDLDSKGYKTPYECVSVDDKNDNRVRKCRKDKDSGSQTLEFDIDRDEREDYKLKFDTSVNASRAGDERDILILNHPLISESDVKKQIILIDRNNKWYVGIPGDNAVIGGSVTLYMERVDDPNTGGTALDAVEVTGSDDKKGRMSFKNQRKDSETETFKIKSSYDTEYYLDLIGLEKNPKRNSGSGDWRDGETFPSGDRIEFFDKDGNDVNAYLHIQKRDPEINRANLEGARFVLTTSNEEFDDDGGDAMSIKGYENKKIKQYAEFTSAQPEVINSSGSVTFSLVSADTAPAPGFTIDSKTGVVSATAPAYNDGGSNDYDFKVKAVDSSTPPKEAFKTKTITVTEEDPVDPPVGGGGTCGIDPPKIRFQGDKWGVLIPDRVLAGSSMQIKGRKRDDPNQHGTALTTFAIEDSNGKKVKGVLDPNEKTAEAEITFNVRSLHSTFYPFIDLDNIRDPVYNESEERLEFRDRHENDANAWLEVNDSKTKFNCDDIPGDPPVTCDPGNWEINGEVYYPGDWPEPSPPPVNDKPGGLRASVGTDGSSVKVNFKNYENKLLTLKLTWRTQAAWDQFCKNVNPYVSDLFINGPTDIKGGSRYGDAGNEYNYPDYTLSKSGGNVTKTLYYYNVDGGDYDMLFSMSSTAGPEPVRETAESVSDVTSGIVQGISVRDEQGDLGDNYTNWGGSATQEFKNAEGGDTPPNWEDGTPEVTSFQEFTMSGGSGTGLKIAAKILKRLGDGGNYRNSTVLIQSITEGGSGYANGDYVTFPAPYNMENVIKISATTQRTDFSCEFTGTETWTEAGGKWPRYPVGAALSKNGGNKVEWAWEDGGGGTWDDQFFTLEIVGERECVPWTGKISMDGQLQKFVWINSSVLETDPDGEPGHSLEDYLIHSDKIRLRRPQTHSSLTNLQVGGTSMEEFRGVAGAKKPEDYGL